MDICPEPLLQRRALLVFAIPNVLCLPQHLGLPFLPLYMLIRAWNCRSWRLGGWPRADDGRNIGGFRDCGMDWAVRRCRVDNARELS